MIQYVTFRWLVQTEMVQGSLDTEMVSARDVT